MTRDELLFNAKPILFNTYMVQAILDNRKTSTRRIIKPQPKESFDDLDIESGDVGFRISMGSEKHYRGKTLVKYYGNDSSGLLKYRPVKTNYKAGDILYIRETWTSFYLPIVGEKYIYRASDPYGNRRPKGPEYDDGLDISPWSPSIHMPKTAARIFLRVLSVRAERLQDISEQNAISEGAATLFKPSDRHKGWNDKWIAGLCSDCERFDVNTGIEKESCSGFYLDQTPRSRTKGGCKLGFTLRSDDEYEPARFRFSYLWDSTMKIDIRYKYGWDANPWVWVYEFERVIPDD